MSESEKPTPAPTPQDDELSGESEEGSQKEVEQEDVILEGQLIIDDLIDKVVEEMEGPGAIEASQVSSGSEDDDAALARKILLKGMQNVMTKATDIQDPIKPAVAIDEDKELIALVGQSRKTRDKPFIQSVRVAERGYVKRLRPSSGSERPTVSQYHVRPELKDKFKSVLVKEMIHSVLNEELGGKEYSEEGATKWSQDIANTIRLKVKEMGFSRYKYIVQCVLGEEHGAGVKIGARCLWDADTDNYASDTFLNDTIFCMTAVYAIYFY